MERFIENWAARAVLFFAFSINSRWWGLPTPTPRRSVIAPGSTDTGSGPRLEQSSRLWAADSIVLVVHSRFAYRRPTCCWIRYSSRGAPPFRWIDQHAVGSGLPSATSQGRPIATRKARGLCPTTRSARPGEPPPLFFLYGPRPNQQITPPPL